MGAFFLARQGASFPLDKVLGVFAAKGFKPPREIELTGARLWLYPKQLVASANEHREEGSIRAFATGSLVYKGNLPAASLQLLARDHVYGRIDPRRLRGAFCALLDDGEGVQVLTDQAGLYHLFSDRERTFLSSSFLAVVAALPQRSVDLAGCLENLVCGYIQAPRTIIKEVQRVETGEWSRPSRGAFRLLRPLAARDPFVPPPTFEQAVDEQLDALRSYFSDIAPLARTLGADLGISGGFDSRLLLLLTRELGCRLSTHTHLKEVPDGDFEVARQVAAALGLPLTTVEGQNPRRSSAEELEETIRAAVMFNDGRVNVAMDLLRSEYTAGYRKAVLGDKGLTLTGVGGEIYRNYDRTSPFGAPLHAWVATHVLGTPVVAAIKGRTARRAIVDQVATSIAARLSMAHEGRLSFSHARRYYVEIWLPSWHGLRNSAENQLAYFLAPFADDEVTGCSLRAAAHVGPGDRLEAALIRALDERVAAIPTSYGFPLDRIPFGARIRAAAWSYLPPGWKSLAGRGLLALRAHRVSPAFTDMTARHPLLGRAFERLRALELPIDWQRYLTNHGRVTLALSLGCALEIIERDLASGGGEGEAHRRAV